MHKFDHVHKIIPIEACGGLGKIQIMGSSANRRGLHQVRTVRMLCVLGSWRVLGGRTPGVTMLAASTQQVED